MKIKVSEGHRRRYQSLYHSGMFISSCFTGFLAFCRLSNLVPLLSKDFDITKHLYRRDFLCDDMGATAIVKWSKTLQSFTQWTLISVLLLTSSTLCPVQAFKVMTSLIPASPNHSV